MNSTSSYVIDSFTLNQTTPNTTPYDWCTYSKENLVFNTDQLVRVIITFVIFLVSAAGNSFVLYCLCTMRRKSHVRVMSLHLTLADIAFTFFVIPMDGAWNITMAWYGGEFMCRLCQMLKLFGMYISSLMVVVTALDRAFSILMPMSTATQHSRRTKVLLIGAWVLAFVSAIPQLILFSTISQVLCPEDPPFVQCVDSQLASKPVLQAYRFFTMCMSFVVPFFVTVISYCLVLFEISKMQKRDTRLVGRRESTSTVGRARQKMFILTSLMTLTFILCWGPYYALGLIYWFNEKYHESIPLMVRNALYLLMYLNSTLHPFIFGLFIRDIRKKFKMLFGVDKYRQRFGKSERQQMETARKTSSTTTYFLRPKIRTSAVVTQGTDSKRYGQQPSEACATEMTNLPAETEFAASGDI